MSRGISLALLADEQVDTLRADVLARLAELAGLADRCLPEGPATWTIRGRAADPVRFGGGTLLIAGGPATAMQDDPGCRARPLTAADVAAFCRLADAVGEVDIIEPPCPGDCRRPGEDRVPVEGGSRLAGLVAAFPVTGKHLLTTVSASAEARAVVEIAAVVAGGPDALRKRPLLTAVVAADGGDGTAAATVAATVAAAGLPLLAQIELSAACATDRNAFVETLAGGLATAAAARAAVPGTSAGLFLSTAGGPASGAWPVALAAASAQIAHSLGVSCAARLPATGAADWPASAETTAATLSAWLTGVDALAGAGLRGGGSAISLIELALDAEIASYVAATQAGVPIDDETLAVEVIEQVGIAGNYLGEKHTRRHMRDVWRPRFFDRLPYEQWVREGRRESSDLATEWVDRTLKEHTAQALDPSLVAELDRIARRYAASHDAPSKDTARATPGPAHLSSQRPEKETP